MNRIQPVTETGEHLYIGIDPLQHHYWELWFATDPYLQEYGLPDLGDQDEEDDVYDCEFCGGEIADDYSTCTCEDVSALSDKAIADTQQ